MQVSWPIKKCEFGKLVINKKLPQNFRYLAAYCKLLWMRNSSLRFSFKFEFDPFVSEALLKVWKCQSIDELASQEDANGYVRVVVNEIVGVRGYEEKDHMQIVSKEFSQGEIKVLAGLTWEAFSLLIPRQYFELYIRALDNVAISLISKIFQKEPSLNLSVARTDMSRRQDATRAKARLMLEASEEYEAVGDNLFNRVFSLGGGRNV